MLAPSAWICTLVAGAALCLLLVVALVLYGKFAKNNSSASSTNGTVGAVAAQPQKSIAVLPFLDLTDEMNQEPFADGMTEELIDKLSKIPGLRVPSATSSFYFKGKLWPRSHGTPQITIAEIAKALGVAYVLDGSVRKSGNEAAGRRAIDSCRQRLRCLVGNLRSAVRRHLDGPGRYRQRSNESAEGIHRGQAGLD